jgi:hypothetical protein
MILLSFICYLQIANGSRETEGTQIYLSKGANLMSQVVYRGVAYDTEIRRQEQAQQQPQQHNETYRGVKFVKESK